MTPYLVLRVIFTRARLGVQVKLLTQKIWRDEINFVQTFYLDHLKSI